MSNAVIREDHEPMRARLGVVALTAALVGVVTQLPSVPTLARQVAGAFGTADQSLPLDTQLETVLLTAFGLLTWAVVSWIGVVLLLGLLTRLIAGPAAAAALLRRLAPKIVRGTLIGAFGVAAVAGVSGCASSTPPTTSSSVSVSEFAQHPGAGSVDLNWPSEVVAPTPAAPGAGLELDWPSTPTATPAATPLTPAAGPGPAAPTMSPPAPAAATSASTATTATTGDAAAATATVLVRPGDSLWSIAAAQLPSNATDRDIDAAWRQIYTWNAAVIGGNPDLIQPGSLLIVPTLNGAAS